jgi:hypothetical protein
MAILSDDKSFAECGLGKERKGRPYNCRGYCTSLCTNAHWCGGDLDIGPGKVHPRREQDGGADAEVAVGAYAAERKRLLVLSSLGTSGQLGRAKSSDGE